MAFLGGLQGLVHHQDLKDAGVVISIASPLTHLRQTDLRENGSGLL